MLPYFVLTIVNILLFLYGFFPINEKSSEEVVPVPRSIENMTLNSETLYTSHFDRVVLIVIDALRNDFVQEDELPFVTSKVKDEGCIMNVRVASPTVTLPRLKSLTTGDVPQFIDIVLNLGDSHALQDSLVHVLHNHNKSIVFYGDDTWLKMFPKMFTRYEGTTSFYVNDFYDVDNNVTRNVRKEVEKNDWDMMILHYLGLDHIGHVFGPGSELVPKKLREMDAIVELIYTELANRSRTLILVTGDHGMKDSGGHGGSTWAETNVPLIVIGSACNGISISQTDIPVNLAALLGVEIPSTSIGLIQKDLLKTLSAEQYLFALRYNTLSLSSKTKMCEDGLEWATKYHAVYIRNGHEPYARKVEQLYQSCSQSIHDYLIKFSIHQNIDIMVVSVLNLCYIFFEVINLMLSENKLQIVRISTIVVINFLYHLSGFFIVFIIVMTILIIPSVLSLVMYSLITPVKLKSEYLFLVAMTLLHPLTFFSSSFIEEEHQYWYFSITTVVYLSLIDSIKFKNIYCLCLMGLLVLFKICRNINQTGDKWASLPDIADWFLKSENYLYLTVFFSICLYVIFHINFKLSNSVNLLDMFVSGSVYGLVLSSYFLGPGPERLLVQKGVWLLIIVQIGIAFCYKRDILSIWISICLLLSKPFNLILIILCILSSELFAKKNKNTEMLTIFHMWLGKVLFFMQGHSNSLASVDVSSGYVALSSYIPAAVLFQVFSHTYTFPILTNLLLLKRKGVDKKWVFSIMFLQQLLVIIIYFIVAILQRHHIFVWSVFAPKLLIESTNCLVLFVQVVLYFAYTFCLYFRINV